MKRILTYLLMAASLFPLLNFAQNPIIQTLYTTDPAPMVYNDTVYLYTGHDEDNATWYVMKDWRCYSSTDMVNWTDHGSPLSLGTFSWAKSDAWAGQCVPRNGKFYWYVPVTKKTGGSAIGVAVSNSPTGPFVDAIGSPLIANSEIDPTVFIDDDGQAYLYWGNPDLYYVKLNENMISYSGAIVKVPLTQAGFGVRTGDATRITKFEEAPWLCKRNNLYYMLYATGALPESIGYSTSPSPIGPWTYQGIIMPAQGGSFTNHEGIVDFKGKSYFFYHNGALPGGGGFDRSVCVEEFTYNADGTIPMFNMTSGVNAVGNLNPYKRNEFETIAWEVGVKTNKSAKAGVYVSDINNSDYIKVRGVDFGTLGAGTFTANVACSFIGGNIELHLDNATGLLIGTLPVCNTGGEDMWKTETTNISGASGIHDVFFVFKGQGTGNLFNVDYWKFEKMSTAHELVAINANVDRSKIDTISGINIAKMKVRSIYADGTSEDVTALATVVPDKEGVVTITNGSIVGTSYSPVNLNVNYGGKTDVLSLSVKDMIGELTVKKLATDSSNVTLVSGGTFSFTIIATYVDGHTQDVTQIASYTNTHPEVALVTKGLITAKIKGSTDLAVSFKGEKGDAVTTLININVVNPSPYIRNEAENFNAQLGIQSETCTDTGGGSDIGFIENGDWIRVNNLDFGAGAASFNARVASAGSGGKIEIRLDSLAGALAGTCTVAVTGGWQTWLTKSCKVTGIAGIHDIFLKFTGTSSYLFNFNWFNFAPSTTSLNDFTDQPAISVISINQQHYLKGVQAGDVINIYNVYGQKVSTFKAITDLELINNCPKVAIIEVWSGKTRSSFKVVL
jgi:hypothetical protein